MTDIPCRRLSSIYNHAHPVPPVPASVVSNCPCHHHHTYVIADLPDTSDTVPDARTVSDSEENNISDHVLHNRDLTRFIKPVIRAHRFVVLLSVPQLAAYLSAPHCQTETAKLLFQEFRDCVRLAVSAFGGVTIGSSLVDEFYVSFERCSDAVACCIHCVELMQKRNRLHAKDSIISLTRPSDILAVVVNGDVLVGDAAEHGWTSSESLLRIVKAFHRHLGTLPLVLVAEPLCRLLKDDFTIATAAFGFCNVVSTIVEACDDESASPLLPKLLTSNAIEAQLGVDASAYPPAMSPDVFLTEVLRAIGGGGVGSPTVAPSSPTGRQGGRRQLNPEVLQLWHQYDADGSGTLDICEVCELLDELGVVMSDKELQKLYAEMDLDGNGTISQDEFAVAFASPTLGGAMVASCVRRAAAAMRQQNGMDTILPVVLATWNKYDTDSSGSLVAIELGKVLHDLGIPLSDEEVEWLVIKLDNDGNGAIEIEEFAALFTEDAMDIRLNLVKARLETVARVIDNKLSQKVFITPMQQERDNSVRRSNIIRRLFAPIIFCYAFYNYGQILYALMLQEDYTTTRALAIAQPVLDIIYVVWFIAKLLFLTGDRSGQPVVRRMDVLRGMFKTFGFYVDIIVLLPVDLVYIGLSGCLSETETVTSLFWWYRVNKMLALFHLEAQLDTMCNGLSPTTYRVVDLMVWYMVAAHTMGCGLLLTARAVGEAAMINVGGSAVLISDTHIRYLMALLWGLQQLQGNLRGNILPRSDKQLTLLLFNIGLSICIFPTMLATFAEAVMAPTASSTLIDRLGSLRDFFTYARKRTNVDGIDEIEADSVAYYKHLFYTTGSLDLRHYPLTDVPVELSVQLRISMGLKLLRKVPIFKNACNNLEFVHELASKLVPRVIEPGICVTRKGERGSNMYFITHGEFHVMGDDGAVSMTLTQGDFFGEIALVRYVRRAATVRCSCHYANVLCLHRRDFDDVLQIFPQCLADISAAAEERMRLVLIERQRCGDESAPALCPCRRSVHHGRPVSVEEPQDSNSKLRDDS